jgi:hypothetical protein
MSFATNWLQTDNGVSKDTLGVVVWTDETMVRSQPFTRNIKEWRKKEKPLVFKTKLTVVV